MRKKKHGAERIAACADWLIEDVTPLATLAQDPTAIFPVAHPVHMEIGCGKGSFAVGMAARNPDVNFIAMERVSDVACCALEKAKATAAEREGDNLRFLIGDACNLAEWVEPHSVSRIYLNFSDPWPKAGHAKRRLTHRNFLMQYKRILKPDGAIFFKTDNRGLFDFSLDEFRESGFRLENLTYDLHNSEWAEGNIMTEYEKNFSAKGFTINRVEAYVR